MRLDNGQPAPLAAGLGQNEGMAVAPKTPGHSIRVLPTQSGRRWLVRCECGLGGDQPNNPGVPSRTYATDAVALAVAIRHLRQVAKAQRESGSTTSLHRIA